MPNVNAFTHAELIMRAARWLQREYQIVATDIVHGGAETPDAIAFRSNGCTCLCEAKASRSDFLADSKKPFRVQPYMGMGMHRYYVCAPGVAEVEDLPPGWGLLVPHGRGLRESALSHPFMERNFRAEQSVLVSLLRRIGKHAPDSIAVKFYTYNTPCPKATLGIEADV